MIERGRVVSNYVVEAHLGSGGMAEVYLVRHRVLNSVHALKVLHLERAKRESIRARFLSEGRLQAQIRHPHIAAVTDVVAETGVAGLIVEYLRGGSLEDRLTRGVAPVSPKTTLAVVKPVLAALAAAHDKGVVHRDLKPANILFRDDTLRAPVLSDFGIAKIVDEGELANERQHRTRTGLVLGTPGYMSPEQVLGAGNVGPEADLFAVGVIAWELLLGSSPYRGASDFEVMQNIVDGKRPDLRRLAPDLGKPLIRVLDRTLAPEREDRYRDAIALARDLTAAVDALGDKADEVPAARWGGKAPAQTWAEGQRVRTQTLEPEPTEELPESEAQRPVTDPSFIRTMAPDEPLRLDGPSELAELVVPIPEPEPDPAPSAQLEPIAVSDPVPERPERPWWFWGVVAAVVIPVLGLGIFLILGATLWAVATSEPEAPEPKRPDVKVKVDVDLPMRRIDPKGPVRVGSPSDERGRDGDEAPLEVSVTPFLLGTTEVTQGQWKDVMGVNPVETGTDRAGGDACGKYGVGDGLPVTCVSWDEVVRFANRLSNLEGLELAYAGAGSKWTWDASANGYRLPTESEWEVAARAGGTARYGTFDDVSTLCTHAWGATAATVEAYEHLEVGNTSTCEGEPGLRPVGSLARNRFGLHDMLGSVSEWTWDVYYPEGVTPVPAAQTLQTARIRQSRGERSVRGGSWMSGPYGLRAATRRPSAISARSRDVGVRLARNAN